MIARRLGDAHDHRPAWRHVGKALRGQMRLISLGCARRNLAENLQHHGVVDDERAVRLLGCQPQPGAFSDWRRGLLLPATARTRCVRSMFRDVPGQRTRRARVSRRPEARGIGQQAGCVARAAHAQRELAGQRRAGSSPQATASGICQRVGRRRPPRLDLARITSRSPSQGHEIAEACRLDI